MKDDGLGLTPEERERLTGQLPAEPQMDFNTSLLAFACLLLICLLVIGASLIARSHVGEPAIEAQPSGAASRSTVHVERNRDGEMQEPESVPNQRKR